MNYCPLPYDDELNNDESSTEDIGQFYERVKKEQQAAGYWLN